MDDWDLETPADRRAPAGVGGGGPAPPSAQPGPAAVSAPGPQPTPKVGPPPTAEPAPAAGGAASRSPRLWWARTRSVWIVGVLVALLVGVLVGFFIARSQAASDTAALVEAQGEASQLRTALSQSEDRNWAYYRENGALKAELQEMRSNQLPTSTTARGSADGGGTRPGGVYRDGVYLVGEDIPPGSYDGVVTATLGYWARLKGTDGLPGAIIANAIARGPFVLTVYPADKAVELRGVEIRPR